MNAGEEFTEFESIGQVGTFLDHVGGLEMRRSSDQVEVRLPLEERHLNPNGTTHGGLILTLLDFTLGVTVEQSLGDGLAGHPITIQLSSSMIGSAELGETIVGTGRIDAATKTMTFVAGEITCEGRTLATATAVFRNPRPIA